MKKEKPYKRYWDNPPPQLTQEDRDRIKEEGLRRRAEYIRKHPPEKVNPAPAGWDEPMEPKKRRRRRK